MYMELNEKNLASVYKNASTTYVPKDSQSESGSESFTDSSESPVRVPTPVKTPVRVERVSSRPVEKVSSRKCKVEEETNVNLGAILHSNKLIFSFVESLEKSVEEILSNIKEYIDYSNEKLELLKDQVMNETESYNSKLISNLESLTNQVMNETNSYKSKMSKYMC